MALYQKVDGVWKLCQRPYVKRNGVWTACREAWVKDGATWVRAYEYDVTPPNPPEISLNVHEEFATIKGKKTLQTRYIRVGVRLAGAANDPDAKLTRVLTTYAGEPPTTPEGGSYWSEPDSGYAHEPWSEWRYNDFGPHKDTSVYAYKQWKPNMKSGNILPGDKTYHFTGWARDAQNNWSVATPAQIHLAKEGVDMPNIITKEARFQPNYSGSWRSNGFTSGKLIQANSPRSTGLWFYGNQITDSVGAHTTGSDLITVKSAQIYIVREDDTGVANADVHLFWTSYGVSAELPAAGANITKHESKKIGTLAKGQGKWFELPFLFKDDLNQNMKGMGLDYKDPMKAGAFPQDYSSVVATATNLRCGELHMVWEEEL